MNGKTNTTLTFGQNTSAISIPIEARSIFRLLAIGTVVRNQTFVQFLSDNLDDILRAIQPTPRLTEERDFLNYSYNHEGDDKGDDKDIVFEKCSEQELCKSKKAFFKNTEYANTLGEVFDYQVPLASSRDAGEGVIDMLSLCDGNTPKIYVIEVKKWDSDEHPLRAMFEALTFWRLLADEGNDKDPRFTNFITCYNKSKRKNRELPPDATIVPAILVCKNSRIYSQMMSKKSLDGTLVELYRKILDRGLRCFRYKQDDNNKLEVEDFTDEFC